MKREWKPGDVLTDDSGRVFYAIEVTSNSVAAAKSGRAWRDGSCVIESNGNGWHPQDLRNLRPLVVIDPEDREQVERLHHILHGGSTTGPQWLCGSPPLLTAALREFANPQPEEPTDPRARVTDFRENVWRLLADGEWVCTSGPDIGEYIVWDRLTAERGPLTVEVTS